MLLLQHIKTYTATGHFSLHFADQAQLHNNTSTKLRLLLRENRLACCAMFNVSKVEAYGSLNAVQRSLWMSVCHVTAERAGFLRQWTFSSRISTIFVNASESAKFVAESIFL